MRFIPSRFRARAALLWLFLFPALPPLQATPDLRFDVVWFCCPCYPDNHFCEPQFDHLNWPSSNGHYLAMPTDAYRAGVNSNGNVLAMYYNTFDDNSWTTNTGAVTAALIDQWASANFTNTGPKPSWLILNELSSGTWPTNQAYRTWATDTVHALHATYGYQVIVYSPFPKPANHPSDWQALAADGIIGVENYLGGQAVTNQNFSVSWCQGQYQGSVTSYGNLGVPKSRLMLGEHFGQTTDTLNGTTVTWGRNNVSYSDWLKVINVRDLAARNVGFPGFLSYAWYSDTMLETDTNLIQFEDAYSASPLPDSNPLTPPFIISQPQDQLIAPGSTAVFSVATAGNTPLAYQWQFNAQNISGATSNSFTLGNVAPGSNGAFRVVISNAAGVTFSSNAWLSVQVPPPLAFDPFAPALTSYAVGGNLAGQTNAAGQSWSAAGPAGANVVITNGNLPVAGLLDASGNSIQFGPATGPSARFNLPGNLTAGVIYYSFAFRVDNLGSLDANGGFFAAFNNASGSQPATPTVIGAGVETRAAGAGFNVGLKKASAGSVFDSAVHQLGETIFVVGSYTINTVTTSDDVANLWINPSPDTFGSGNAPAPTLNSASGSDLSGNQIASFVFFRRGTGSANLEPASLVADELRIGTSWASVTPPAIVIAPPTLNVMFADTNVILTWPTNSAGFNLETAATLSAPIAWTAATDTVVQINGQYAVTNLPAAGQKYYRLHKP